MLRALDDLISVVHTGSLESGVLHHFREFYLKRFVELFLSLDKSNVRMDIDQASPFDVALTLYVVNGGKPLSQAGSMRLRLCM